ncbi:MAG: cryptochrome/photolyase family protein [Verrucomicrobiota bacterium]
MSDITLFFPHQLFAPHPAVKKGRAVAFIEDSLLFGEDPHHPIQLHQQKVVLHRASMKTLAAKLESAGHEVIYRDFQNGKTTETHLNALHRAGYREFHYCDPVDFILQKRLRRWFDLKTNVRAHVHESPMFLTPKDWAEDHFSSRKRPFMAKFYEEQRRRMGILLDKNGEPEGGRWSYDDENRKPMPKNLECPPDPVSRSTEAVREAVAYTEKKFSNYYGVAAEFNYPVSHSSAERWFENFLSERFDRFGPYEDAISGRERVLFHSVLTPMLNVGLLTPQKVIDRALEFATDAKVPLNSLEGFVRQIIGWREFMRVMYERHGMEARNGNFWGFDDEPIPEAFYTGETGIPPIDDAIHRALSHGYCHHIERLMLLGNFMLLCRFHPRRVYQWFMEMFIDAYDWVMVPNVYGMSQFADGGIFTTKPYISGSNYVRKMSDYGKGDWCDTWDGLFWSFIADNDEYFRKQHRLGMMVRTLEKMNAAKQKAHRVNAERFLQGLRDGG